MNKKQRIMHGQEASNIKLRHRCFHLFLFAGFLNQSPLLTMAAQCSLLTDLKWALLIMVIIGIFCISIKIRNIFVLFVESMNIKTKRTGSQRSAKLFPKFSKGFAYVVMSNIMLWFHFFCWDLNSLWKVCSFLVGPVECSSSNLSE